MTEKIPLLMAEDTTEVTVQSDLGTSIVEHQNGQYSGEGFAEHTGARPEPTTPEERSWRAAFLDSLEASKPIVTDKDRAELDAARERAAEHEEAEATEESEEGEEQEEQEAPESSPLEAFDPDSIRQWAEYLNLDENDLQNPKIAQMLAAQMQDAVDTAEQQSTQQTQAQPQTYQPTQEEFDEYVQELHRVVDNPQINDPVMMKAFTDGLSHFLGDGSPDAVKNAEGLGRLLTAGGLNLMSSAVPAIVQHCLPQMIDAYMPGLRQMAEDANNHNAWESARNEVSRQLPELDSEEFNQLRESVLKVAPWLTTVQWKDPQGRALPSSHPEAIRQSAVAFARIAAGQKVSPEMIQKAQATARREAQGHTRRISASRSLGAGKPRSSFARESGRNEFLEAIQTYNQNQHGNFEEK
jgi:hypothetical protein